MKELFLKMNSAIEQKPVAAGAKNFVFLEFNSVAKQKTTIEEIDIFFNLLCYWITFLGLSIGQIFDIS